MQPTCIRYATSPFRPVLSEPRWLIARTCESVAELKGGERIVAGRAVCLVFATRAGFPASKPWAGRSLHVKTASTADNPPVCQAVPPRTVAA